MEILKWQKIASNYLVQERWATLRVDTCKLQNGAVKDDYYVLEYPNWVNAVALTKENKIILVRQYRYEQTSSPRNSWRVIDDNGEFEIAIKRELQEETGYTFESCELVATLYANPAHLTTKHLPIY